MCGKQLLTVVLIACALTGICAQQCGGEVDPDAPRAPPPKHFNIVLVGATGDLAKKYLWNALFDLFSKHYVKGKTAFAIYACARAPADSGRQVLSQIMLDVVQCKDDAKCRQIKTDFVAATQYHQLDKEKHYKKLADKMGENTQSVYGMQDDAWTAEEGRLFYLSIPPSAYAKTARLLAKHVRPRLGRPWLRLVVEKPFGRDKVSAEKLAEKLSEHFKEEEIYRVDHYLGKPAVRAILPFREKNAGWLDPLWSAAHIERVEIVMKETLDVRGRTSFYDDTGVVRDVMQNHLTEILALVAMELPGKHATINDIISSKIRLLHSVSKLDQSSILIGQYHEYPAEVEIERNKTGYESRTPTFAAALLHVNNARWKGVPFVLMSGKKLDEKSSHVRVVFKNTRFCVDSRDESCNKKSQIVFQIASDDPLKPVMIFASGSLPEMQLSMGWKRGDSQLESQLFGERLVDSQHLVPDSSPPDAYSALLGAVFERQRHLFTSFPLLMASWHIWSDAVVALNQSRPRTYEGQGRDSYLLDFAIKGKTLEFIADTPVQHIHFDEQPSFANIPSEFLGNKIISKPTQELNLVLASDIQAMAETAISERGVFHVAFPGGASPQPLFRALATQLYTFPWQHTHVWLVDERCVPTDSPNSNFNMLQRELLEHIQIPHSHVHPWPVQLLSDELCSADDGGAALHEAALHRHLTNHSFDFMVLGVGMDTHVASLFPGQSEMHSDDLVAMVTLPEDSDIKIKKRLTLTLRGINSARRVALLVTGRSKHGMLGALASCESAEECPVLGVRPPALTWYIDHAALFG